jgi:hypothetical protein
MLGVYHRDPGLAEPSPPIGFDHEIARGDRLAGGDQLADGRLDRVKVRYDEQARWLVVERGELRVAANLGPAEQRVDLGDGAGTEVLIASDDRIAVEGGVATLPPDTVVICGP